ncbi:hypothetical protein AX15_006755 [Amanita polypyramis BW_CC]|nr:hypothetical protein AX15_006755 [Amanita polypyramis BW_CC]
MSNPTPQSRLSVDLGVGKKLVTSRSVRQNPPRLQHSPSLPNIWFPPHSGPLPVQIIDGSRNPLQRPSTPPPNMVTSATQRKTAAFPDNNAVYETSDGTIPPATLGDHSRAPSKKDEHLRSDSDAPPPLLTPPLTPSSSIVTRSDSVGTRNNDTQATSCAEEVDSEPEASRFLLVGNVARHIHPDLLRAAVVTALQDFRAKAPFDNDDNVPPAKKSSSSAGDIVKGVFVHDQESHGTVVLAFYDVRYAEFAKSTLSVSTSGALAECVDNKYSGDDAGAWLTCRFATEEELVKTFGDPVFLAYTDGAFYVTVEYDNYFDVKGGTGKHGVEFNGKASLQTPDTDANGEARKLNLAILRKYLESFGNLRYFTPTDASIGKSKDKERVKSFHVEYFDIREADTAFGELNGQTIFGMKLKVYHREVPDTILHHALTAERHIRQPSPVHQEKDAHPSPQINLSRCKDNKIQIPLPGQLSYTRERFSTEGKAPNTNNGADPTYSSVMSNFSYTRSADAPSPTHFYTTNPGPLFSPTMRELNNHPIIGDANGYVVSNVTEPSSSAKHDPERPQMQNTENGIHDARYWNADFQNGAYHFYYPRPDYFYCPSQKDAISNGLAYNASAPMTPNPTVFYPSVQSNVQPGMLYPIPQQVATAYGFENETVHAQTPMGIQNWGLDHAIMVAGGTGQIPLPSPVVPGAAEHWYTDSQAPLVASCQFYPSQVPNSQNYSLPYCQKGPFGPQSVPSPSLFISSARTPTPPTHTSIPMTAIPQTASSVPREPAASPERNQLNLARIEDGQDTRTTVMIKNIPNKMSDKDLLTFIHKVCPRKIDFLYLRMDFKNGCNVGYAFVNFIHVQDLLTFAKKKLGEKW